MKKNYLKSLKIIVINIMIVIITKQQNIEFKRLRIGRFLLREFASFRLIPNNLNL